MADFSNHPLRKRYSLDTAMSEIWDFYKKWFVPLFIIAFVSSLVTNIIGSKIDISGIQPMQDPAEMLEVIKPFAGTYFMVFFVGIIFFLILQYFIIIKPVDEEQASAGLVIKGMGRFLVPMLVVYIVLSAFAVIAVMLGVIALIIGAFFAMFYVMIFFSLAAPVMMIENRSIAGTITRIFSLGHKKFGINFGWVSLFVLLLLIISLVISAIVLIPFTGGILKTILNPESAGDILDYSQKPIYLLFSSLAGALTAPLFPIFSLVLYFNVVSYEESSPVDSNWDSDNGKGPTVEDLYAGAYPEKKRSTRKKSDEKGPTVEDLAP